MLRPMSARPPILLRLEIEAGSEPISGLLRGEGEPPLAFVGWLGLAAAIERTLRAAGEDEEKMRDGPS